MRIRVKKQVTLSKMWLEPEKVAALDDHTILITKNKAEIPIDDSAAPIINDKGDLIGVVLVFRNISERRKS